MKTIIAPILFVSLWAVILYDQFIRPYHKDIVIAVILIILSCSCKEEDPGPQMGCSTGIRNGVRKLLRCCTREDWLAGNNVAAGGVSYFQNYTQHKWEPVAKCQICYDKYQ